MPNRGRYGVSASLLLLVRSAAPLPAPREFLVQLAVLPTHEKQKRQSSFRELPPEAIEGAELTSPQLKEVQVR